MTTTLAMTNPLVKSLVRGPVDSDSHPCDARRVKTLAARIRWVLTDKGWSGRELGRRAGLAESHVGRILRVLDENPDAGVETKTLVAIAKAAGVSDAWLLAGVGSPTEPLPPADNWTSTPTFGALSNWPALLAVAKVLRPLIPEWVWLQLAGSRPLLTAPPTPVQIVELAEFILRHEQPPAHG